jgi:hypothetical protein
LNLAGNNEKKKKNGRREKESERRRKSRQNVLGYIREKEEDVDIVKS